MIANNKEAFATLTYLLELNQVIGEHDYCGFVAESKELSDKHYGRVARAKEQSANLEQQLREYIEKLS